MDHDFERESKHLEEANESENGVSQREEGVKTRQKRKVEHVFLLGNETLAFRFLCDQGPEERLARIPTSIVDAMNAKD